MFYGTPYTLKYIVYGEISNIFFFSIKVDGIDLRNASHDQAVDAIRTAGTPVMFVVQSLCDAACVSTSFYCNQEGGFSGLVVPVMFAVQSLCDAACVSK